MVERSNKPGPLNPTSSTLADTATFETHSDRVKLSLPTGETAEILLHGATVISWKAGGEEKLWLSEKAVLDGSKAVRGGIPLVFPVFGKTTSGPTSALPQHGFARVSKWEVLGKSSASATSICVDFGLGSENVIVDFRKQWPFDFGLIYSVTLTPMSLETKLLVRNEGNQAFDFQTLFHTYLRVADVGNVKVLGLKGVTYRDKTQGGAEIKEEPEAVEVKGEIDRMYVQAPGEVQVEESGKTVYTVTRTEDVKDVVVWNPWENASKNMGDFGPETGYRNMICVEAGTVSEWNTLEPQTVWEGGVTVSL
ncbi:galactose mutarotase-like protein [Ascodesmis nigricans]|uniref:Glucose-6-phosphate 1-epimerase n=1 Tax=Ascodesmis nigricans TaxID=341454 RepID=A0A4S2MT36_9PEZI|nr:galactose mutarotase-like protein [Ascodesmis nigricans]